MSTFDDFAIGQMTKAHDELSALQSRLDAAEKERDEARAKIAKVMRLVNLAEAATDAQTEQEVAHSASFNEALALETLAMTEQERDSAYAALRKCADALEETANNCCRCDACKYASMSAEVELAAARAILVKVSP